MFDPLLILIFIVAAGLILGLKFWLDMRRYFRQQADYADRMIDLAGLVEGAIFDTVDISDLSDRERRILDNHMGRPIQFPCLVVSERASESEGLTLGV